MVIFFRFARVFFLRIHILKIIGYLVTTVGQKIYIWQFKVRINNDVPLFALYTYFGKVVV